jgi:hypothetical protein
MRWIVLLALLTAGCSTIKAEPVARCHGPRRPANPHGSVLVPDPAQVAPPTPSAPAPSGCGSRP